MTRMGEIHWHGGIVTREERFRALGVRGATLWFTGLSGSGKSTIACALEARLIGERIPCYRLDGDNLRTGINQDLGFSERDRAENVRRIAEIAALFADSGAIALVGAISPFRADRAKARALHGRPPREGSAIATPFIEIFVDTPLDECERRDPKGLYRKARAGELPGFTGVDGAYEPPTNPDLVLTPATMTVDECVDLCRRRLADVLGRAGHTEAVKGH